MTAKEYGWQPYKPVPPVMPLTSIKEVFRLFLAQPWPEKSHRPASQVSMAREPEELLQAALLTLKPLERATVVWRYVTGLQVAELAPVASKEERDLYRNLSRALHELSRWLKLAG
jgi:DNA-directed RNA polymerase specialized sigma24 family protein